MPLTPQYTYIPPISCHFLTPLYDACCAITGLGKRFKRKVLTSVQIQDNAVVADIGCGTGVFLSIAHTQYPNVHFLGLDPDAKALAIAQRRLQHSGFQGTLKQAYAEALPLPETSIDVCVSTLVLHHMPDAVKQKALQEMYRVLKLGGFVVIADFGATKSLLMRAFAWLEHVEYMKGNFQGLIPHYLTQVGFQNIHIAGKHFPGIHIIKAQKILHV